MHAVGVVLTDGDVAATGTGGLLLPVGATEGVLNAGVEVRVVPRWSTAAPPSTGCQHTALALATVAVVAFSASLLRPPSVAESFDVTPPAASTGTDETAATQATGPHTQRFAAILDIKPDLLIVAKVHQPRIQADSELDAVHMTVDYAEKIAPAVEESMKRRQVALAGKSPRTP